MRAMLVLVGPNGVGKTNILHAIQWVALAAVGREPPAREPNTASVVLQFRLNRDFRKLIGPKQLQLVEMHDLVGFDAVDRHSTDLGDLHEMYYGPAFIPVVARGRRERDWFSFGDLSFGTRRLLRLMLSLVADKATVMLIEHPEDGIHRGLVQKVFAVLRSYRQRTQVIVATHSTSVLNRFEPDEVRLVTMRDEQTRVRGLKSEELDAAKRYIEEEGTLSDYLELTADG